MKEIAEENAWREAGFLEDLEPSHLSRIVSWFLIISGVIYVNPTPNLSADPLLGRFARHRTRPTRFRSPPCLPLGHHHSERTLHRLLRCSIAVEGAVGRVGSAHQRVRTAEHPTVAGRLRCLRPVSPPSVSLAKCRFAFGWFVAMQKYFFSEGNVAYICICARLLFVDWKSMYFIELLWIAQTYSHIAISATYVMYLVIDVRLSRLEAESP